MLLYAWLLDVPWHGARQCMNCWLAYGALPAIESAQDALRFLASKEHCGHRYESLAAEIGHCMLSRSPWLPFLQGTGQVQGVLAADSTPQPVHVYRALSKLLHT